MSQPIGADSPADRVRRITFVPFLANGRCVLIEEPARPAAAAALGRPDLERQRL